MARPRKDPGTPSVGLQNRARIINRILCSADPPPLQVICETMSLIYSEGQQSLAAADQATDPETKAKRYSEGKAACILACTIAEKALPYVHARLVINRVQGDQDNPLKVDLGLLDAAALKAAVRGQIIDQTVQDEAELVIDEARKPLIG